MRFLAAGAILLTCACTDNGDSCDNKTADVGDVCLPASIAPGIPSVIEVRELCGNGCSDMPSCTALLRNASVALDVTQDQCISFLSGACLDQGCIQRVMHCTLPALNEGRYTLTVPGGPSRTMLVKAGGESSCRFTLSDGGVQ
ncbi:MAG: hypothetical protein ABR567_17440 [Myxococcales bacterium]|nr:hypothetical protein [Myxococcales bacterium]